MKSSQVIKILGIFRIFGIVHVRTQCGFQLISETYNISNSKEQLFKRRRPQLSWEARAIEENVNNVKLAQVFKSTNFDFKPNKKAFEVFETWPELVETTDFR